ncbi:MAG: CDP-alcohol phosphatidyltransferase family protein [Tenacibaculum sp.]
MSIKKHLPNIITLGNMLCGTMATLFAVDEDFYKTALMVLIGIGLDFADGFIARILKVHSELGKHLDSLADMVTSGVVPGIVMLQLLANAIDNKAVGYFGIEQFNKTGSLIPYAGLLLSLAAGYRLAKFTANAEQSDNFIGLPAPAMSLFVVFLPLANQYTEVDFFKKLIQDQHFLLIVTIALACLMNARLHLFSLKFKTFSLKENSVKYIFLVLSIALIVLFKIVGIPLIILLYIILSVLEKLIIKHL